jgi:hypothetical protein
MRKACSPRARVRERARLIIRQRALLPVQQVRQLGDVGYAGSGRSDRETMRRFARVELGDEVVPDESTIFCASAICWTRRSI